MTAQCHRADAWRAVLNAAAPSPLPFTTPTWLDAWRRHLAVGGRLRVWSDGPLRSGGALAPELLVGAGPVKVSCLASSEVSDVSAYPGGDVSARWALLRARLAAIGRGEAVSLGRLDNDGDASAVLADTAAAHGLEVCEIEHSEYPFFDYGQRDVTSLLNRLDKRNDVRRRRRRLAEVGRVEFVFDLRPRRAALAVFLRLHALRWQAKGAKPSGIFTAIRGIRFLEALFDGPDIDQPRISVVTLDGMPVVARFGFERNGVYFGMKSAFDPAFEQYGPGHLVVSELLHHGVEAGWSRFEFMRGDSEHKRAWASGSRTVPYLVVGRAGSPSLRLAPALLAARYRLLFRQRLRGLTSTR